ncbi:MAG TPA: hypothetical protein VHY48_04880 [Acidobacteriaceae bacterium]|jgi:hypothetical protein|nr:hypothetical protein [Acidobacteriaceae bacterium]
MAAGAAHAADHTVKAAWVTIPLDSLGVPAMPSEFLSHEMSMLTVDFVDDSHLLVTFSTRGLIPRLPGDPPDDDDRMVAAELVELPSAHVVARKEWHFHDHAQYLWRLGEGRFLVRTRNTLFAITPRALENSADPLVPISFPQREGRPVMAMLSPDASLVMVETLLPKAMEAAQGRVEMADVGDDEVDAANAAPKVAIDFYRLSGGEEPAEGLTVTDAGMYRSPELVVLPMDHDGYLWAGDPKRDQWPLSFSGYGGEEKTVGTVDSSCAPRMQMVSGFEYVAFACQGTADRVKLEAFGMDGHEMWEEGFGAMFGPPSFAYAPSAGRFAMSRISSALGEGAEWTTIPDDASQEVRVYQTESGDLLLRAPCSPVIGTAENFDLSEDGRLAVVVNGGSIQVYQLPAPSAQDRKDLKLAASFAPPKADGPVKLTRLLKSAAAAAKDEAAAAAGTQGAAAGSGAAAVQGAGAPVAGAASGGSGAAAGSTVGSAGAVGNAPAQAKGSDKAAAGEAARKPPSLLEPGESPEFKGAAGSQPQ